MKNRYKVLVAFAINVVIAAVIFFMLPDQSALASVTGAVFLGYVLYLS
jgi:hypothetical protein